MQTSFSDLAESAPTSLATARVVCAYQVVSPADERGRQTPHSLPGPPSECSPDFRIREETADAAPSRTRKMFALCTCSAAATACCDGGRSVVAALDADGGRDYWFA
ncbi:hypothetical protein GCM10010401_08190 [Rarobacter faecitabidus]|uniref:Uncharacterized protein n=1 Tax=Rarobacter faecitabidus TaxID=13243 RepID=A0A542ZAS0_RARFA|nr:hypothetical protein [Rarobacter faecitabidus]TQL57425.1 hypothetical protein FB461_2159 [Rarobacter faecitabidus]